MRVLGFDTATASTAVAVWDTVGDRGVQLRDDPPPGERPRHTTRLLALVVAALAEAETGWAEIERIAVGVGPGTFTGLRIGVATARALASAREIPVTGVSTLRALAVAATPAAAAAGRRPLAVLDARRREVFAAGWPLAPTSEPAAAEATPLLAPAAVAPAELAERLAGEADGWLAVGDGAVAFRQALEAVRIAVPEDGSELHRVSASEICRLGATSAPGEAADIHPEYLRVPDAELTRIAAGPPR
jgi:tRNA threonylcarbamoyladenosine biosynthesis protein TsaB